MMNEETKENVKSNELQAASTCSINAESLNHNVPKSSSTRFSFPYIF